MEAFGRPTWREWRRRSEAATLRSTSVPLEATPIRRVVVAPGFGGSPTRVAPLVDWLAAAGHVVQVADLDGNHRSSTWAVGRITEALETDDEPAVLIGHSRGGQQCRVAAQRTPHLVEHLITLGAPVRAHLPKHFILRAAVESLRFAAMLGARGGYDRQADREYEATLFAPFMADVPWTAIHSRSDGFVAWQACMDAAATDIEVDCSHRGLIASVPAFTAIAATMSAMSPLRDHDESVHTGA
jgi:pimeloyl-ACP methyl ester carboxylesterase